MESPRVNSQLQFGRHRGLELVRFATFAFPSVAFPSKPAKALFLRLEPERVSTE